MKTWFRNKKLSLMFPRVVQLHLEPCSLILLFWNIILFLIFSTTCLLVAHAQTCHLSGLFVFNFYLRSCSWEFLNVEIPNCGFTLRVIMYLSGVAITRFFSENNYCCFSLWCIKWCLEFFLVGPELLLCFWNSWDQRNINEPSHTSWNMKALNPLLVMNIHNL